MQNHTEEIDLIFIPNLSVVCSRADCVNMVDKCWGYKVQTSTLYYWDCDTSIYVWVVGVRQTLGLSQLRTYLQVQTTWPHITFMLWVKQLSNSSLSWKHNGSYISAKVWLLWAGLEIVPIWTGAWMLSVIAACGCWGHDDWTVWAPPVPSPPCLDSDISGSGFILAIN